MAACSAPPEPALAKSSLPQRQAAPAAPAGRRRERRGDAPASRPRQPRAQSRLRRLDLIRDQAAQEARARRGIGIARPFDLGRQGVRLVAR